MKERSMLAREFRVAMRHLHLNEASAAKLLCVSKQEISEYSAGARGVPQVSAMLLRVAAGLGRVGKLVAADIRGRGKLVESHANSTEDYEP
jgi:hypothetical protein